MEGKVSSDVVVLMSSISVLVALRGSSTVAGLGLGLEVSCWKLEVVEKWCVEVEATTVFGQTCITYVHTILISSSFLQGVWRKLAG